MNFVGITPELMALFGAGFWHGAIVFLRIGAMTSIMLGFGEQLIPTQIRLVAGLVFTAIVAPALPQMPIPETVMQYAGSYSHGGGGGSFARARASDVHAYAANRWVDCRAVYLS